MKLSQFAVVFAIIMTAVIIYTDISTNNLKAVFDNKEQIDRNLDSAVDDGITSLIQADESNHVAINKDRALKSFFLSLYSSFRILTDKSGQDRMNLYIPVVVVTEEDGFYVFYSDESYGTDGKAQLMKCWSEQYPYYYEDEFFVYRFTLGEIVTIYDKNNLLDNELGSSVYQSDYHALKTEELLSDFRQEHPDYFIFHTDSYEQVRKQTMIDCLERTMSYYTSKHNKIAENYGITYQFSLPTGREGEWADYIEDISMFVVFQGYPYGTGVGETYNRVLSAGTRISKSGTYFIEQKGWYLVYHRSNCKELMKEGILLRDELYYDAAECIRQGCYQCPVCEPGGAYAPDYTP